MSDNYRKERIRSQQLIRQHCAALHDLLSHRAADDPNAYKSLEHQGDVLAALLDATMKSMLENAQYYGYLNEDKIALALRIQKQCTDTTKAAAAIEYMRALSAHNGAEGTMNISGKPTTPLPLPLPPKSEERNG